MHFLTELKGSLAALESLQAEHHEDLLSTLDPCGEAYTNTPRDADSLAVYLDQALALQRDHQAAPYLIRCHITGRPAGCTRFANLEWWAWDRPDPCRVEGMPDALEIGWTWLVPWARGTGINPDVKRLLLTDAFERLQVKRVTLKTDVRNAPSRAAIERLGAKLDGVLRCHMPASDSGCRDSAMYSILRSEWPAVRLKLVARVARRET